MSKANVTDSVFRIVLARRCPVVCPNEPNTSRPCSQCGHRLQDLRDLKVTTLLTSKYEMGPKTVHR